jgi:hypothetical protein
MAYPHSVHFVVGATSGHIVEIYSVSWGVGRTISFDSWKAKPIV